MPKRYHLKRPDLAQAVAVELRTCTGCQKPTAAAGSATGRQRAVDRRADCRAVGDQRPPFFRLDERAQGRRAGRIAGASARWRRRAASARRCPPRTAGRVAIWPVEVGQGDSALAAGALYNPPETGRGVLLAGKIGRGLESAAQDPRAKRRGSRPKCSSERSANSWRT